MRKPAVLWNIDLKLVKESNTACIYLLKVNNRNSGTRCEICSKLTITSFWCLYCSLWTYFTPCSSVSIFNLEHVIADWDRDGNWAVSVMLSLLSLNKSHILFRMASLLTWSYFFSYDWQLQDSYFIVWRIL